MIIPHFGWWPVLGKGVYIAEGARVIGEARLDDGVSLWPGAVVRADVFPITIGEKTNVQDFTMIHCTGGRYRTTIGREVTIGHHVTLHGCTLEDRCLVGIGSTVLDQAVVGEEAMIGAGSLVTPGKKIPPRVLAMGAPAKVVRDLTPEEIASLKVSAEHYAAMAAVYRADRGITR